MWENRITLSRNGNAPRKTNSISLSLSRCVLTLLDSTYSFIDGPRSTRSCRPLSAAWRTHNIGDKPLYSTSLARLNKSFDYVNKQMSKPPHASSALSGWCASDSSITSRSVFCAWNLGNEERNQELIRAPPHCDAWVRCGKEKQK
jgi:hypothetical protein